MSCQHAHDDGAYVLGALSPADRQAFERHLPECAECTRAVGELAGLPGLLSGVGAHVLDESEADDPIPSTVLPGLFREVRNARRRRTWAVSGLAAAAAAAVVVALAVGQPGDDEGAALPDPVASSSPTAPPSPAPTPRPMQPVGEVPVRATVTLEQVTWGTRLGLACTYDTELVGYALPPEVDYLLFVRTRDGRAERLGSWRSVDGLPMELSAGTAASAAELESVEVRTADGRVVLRLPT